VRRAALVTLALGLGAAPARAADLVVDATGARDATGRIVVSLWSKPDGFGRFDAAKALATRTLAATPGRPARVTFEGLAPGRYAVSAFHDADGDGKLKTNFIGIPREGVGVSNNAGGIPSFDKARIDVPAPGPVGIELRYLGG
jgi:uncharacterized protein (DUF2141 family)